MLTEEPETHSPLISVVIPVYNREETIDYCLQSVLRQTFPDFEVVVVDDGSSDSTVDRIGNIQDPRIRLLKTPVNAGAQAARNLGIRAARGQWIAFLDSDDYWMSDKLEKQVNLLRENGFDYRLVVHSDCEIEENGVKKGIWRLPEVTGEAYEQLLAGPGPMFQGMLVSKRLLEEIDYLDESVPSYQEWDTAIRLARIGRYIHMREPTFVYCFHEGPTISEGQSRQIDGYLYVLRKFRPAMVASNVFLYDRQILGLLERAADFGLRERFIPLMQVMECRICAFFIRSVYSIFVEGNLSKVKRYFAFLTKVWLFLERKRGSL